MTDSELIGLFNARDERAISEIKLRYGAYCFTAAMNILRNSEDAEECINDALLAQIGLHILRRVGRDALPRRKQHQIIMMS